MSPGPAGAPNQLGDLREFSLHFQGAPPEKKAGENPQTEKGWKGKALNPK